MSDLLEQMTNCLVLLSEKDPKLAKKFKLLLEEVKDKESIDESLLERLKQLSQFYKTQLLTRDQYDELLQKINQNSINLL